MTAQTQRDFTHNLLLLLKETFEEGGSFYLEKGAGLFQTLDAITAEVASRKPSSWRVGRVSSGEWNDFKASLRSGYDDLRQSLNSLSARGDDAVCDGRRLSHTPRST